IPLDEQAQIDMALNTNSTIMELQSCLTLLYWIVQREFVIVQFCFLIFRCCFVIIHINCCFHNLLFFGT
ncbi:hypothetical protein ACJX0J_030088, partial [Zea mays]